METFQIHPRLSYKKIGEESLILDTKIHRAVHQLNDVATFLWSACEEPKKMDELVDLLIKNYEVEPSVAEADTRQFLAELCNKELLLIHKES
jgi:hypothetical protein